MQKVEYQRNSIFSGLLPVHARYRLSSHHTFKEHRNKHAF